MGYNASDGTDCKILMFLILFRSFTHIRLCSFNLTLSLGYITTLECTKNQSFNMQTKNEKRSFRALKATSKWKRKKEHNIEKTKQMQELARRKEIKREGRKLKMKKGPPNIIK